MEISGVNNIITNPKLADRLTNATSGKTESKTSQSLKPASSTIGENEQIAKDIEKMLQFFETNNSVKFQYDKSINRIIIQVVNDKKSEVIKQIPPEDIVRFLKAFNELIGIIIDKEI